MLAEVPDSEGEDLSAHDIIECWDQAHGGWVPRPCHCPPESAAAAQGSNCVAAENAHDQGSGRRVDATAGNKARSGATHYDYETVFTNAKAGMDDVDKDYVKKVVHEMSKDSNFFKNEQRKNEENSRRNDDLKLKLDALSPWELDKADKWAARYMQEQERTCDLTRTFIHVDMDMFFAAVEQMKRPELKDLAFAIGGLGMISTANYVARKYGVRSGMPGFIGKVLCCKPVH